MNLQIADLVASFFAGLVATGFGGVQIFIICAGTCLIGLLTKTDTTGFAFGPILNPAVTFLPAAVASGYANFKGYNGGGNGPANSMMTLQKPDVLLIGGIFGVIGWIFNSALGSLGLAGFDTVAFTVMVTALIMKIVFQKTATGVVPEEDKALGGRYSPLGGRGWYAGMRRGIDKAIWPAAYGAFIGVAMVLLVKSGTPQGLAGVLGFAFGGFVLVFPTVPAQHFIGCAVCTAIGFIPDLANNPDAIMLAVAHGLGWGTLAANMADFSADTFSRYSYVAVDIPAGSIWMTTLIIALVNLAAPSMFTTPVLSLGIWVVLLAYGLFYDAKWKKFAASKGLTY